MWNIYLDTRNGIAIQSTFDRFKNSFNETEEDIYMSVVKYTDYNNTSYKQLRDDNKWSTTSSGSTINPGIYKRKSFEYENELRAFYIDTPIEYDLEKVKARSLPNGKKISINLEVLIEKIYIAPKADTWFKNLVESILGKYEIHVPIERSTLYERRYLV